MKGVSIKVVVVAAVLALMVPFLAKAQWVICGKDGSLLSSGYADQNSCKNALFSNSNYLNSGAGCMLAASCPGAQAAGGSLPPVLPNAPSGGQTGSPAAGAGQGVTPNYAPIPAPTNYSGPTTASGIINIINNVLYYISIAFWIAAAGFVFYAAFLYLTASGNPERVSKAHRQLLWAVVAIAVGLMTRGLPYFINQLLNLR